MKSVPPDILNEKKSIALAVEFVVDRVKGVSLIQANVVGASYPLTLGVPGVAVFGPDREGRFEADVHIAVAGMKIPEATDTLRSELWKEFRNRGIADRVKNVDIYVEDLMMAV
ncbi:MAG TPA: hypothetical protein VE439_08660 [Anaerolineae bacterium]|nr:hypothetical protein [Anaerolineae bacterium]